MRFKLLSFGLSVGLILGGCGAAAGPSLDEIRSDFVAAGGICAATSDGSASSTTTTDSQTTEKSGPFASLEYLNCGEGEADIYKFASEQDARASWLVIGSLFDGLMLSIGFEVSDRRSIVIEDFRINLPIDEYSVTQVSEIAKELGGYVLSSNQTDVRREILSEIASGSGNGGLTALASSCGAKDNLSSDGQSVSFDTEGEEDENGDSLFATFCLLRATVAPDYIFDSIKATRALDGRMEETYGEYRASWNYHPDDGIKLTLIFVDSSSR
jgi:hypothetical protein